MKLHQEIHTFELLTPAWAGGATPSESAEIRVSTLRGQLRQWLRLLYPKQHLDKAVFGSIADGEGANASLVQLRLVKAVVTSQTQDLAGYTGRSASDAVHHPEGYFLWPLRTQKRGVLLPGQASRFSLEVRWYPRPSSGLGNQGHEAALSNAIRAFSILGTLGTRATRGYGSVWKSELSFESSLDLSAALTFLPDEIIVRLHEGEYGDGRQALAAAARWMRGHRVGSSRFGDVTNAGKNDHDVADPMQPVMANAQLQRHALGMPLTQRFKRGNDVTNVQSKYRNAGIETDRYPSPVHIKVIKLGGKYRVLIVILRQLLLPEGTTISLSTRRTASLSHDLIGVMAAEGTSIH